MNISEHSLLVPDFPVYPVQLMLWNEPDPWDIALHNHEFDELLFFYKGGGIHKIGNKVFPILDYHVHFIPKGVNHVLNREVSSSGFTLAYDRSFLEQHLKIFLQGLSYYKKPLKFSYSLSPSAFHKVLELKAKIEFEINNSNEYFSHALFQGYVSTLLLELAKEINDSNSSNNLNQRQKNIIVRFEEHLQNQKSLSELHIDKIAKALFISPQQLYEICKLKFNKNPKKLIDESIITMAKNLLRKGDLNTYEISDQLGFSEVAAFSRFFKKYTGLSPSKFNKKV